MDKSLIVQKVQEAAKIANAHDFITELSDGYHTSVGERGSRLSGGQRQRVAIARAIVSNPAILLLDEATAALDTKTERLVQDALFAAAKGRTTIIIAHRLSTIRKADKIVVVEHGHITEQGTHEELLAAGTTYAALVKAQQLSGQTDSEGQEMTLPLKEATTNKLEKFDVDVTVKDVSRKRMEDSSFTQLVRLVWEFNYEERYYIICGVMASVITGAAYPVQGIFFGNSVITLTDPKFSNGSHPLNFWCLMFLMLAVILLVMYGIQGYSFSVAGARLGSRARSRAFESILRQDMAFFDREENSSGILTAFLSIQATKLTGISGNTFAALLNGLMTLVSGVVIGCTYGWKLGLVSTATIPVLIACSFMRFWVVTQTERRFKKGTDAASRACEAVGAIRTVAALTMEETISRQYAESLMADHGKTMMLDVGSAVTYALSQSLGVLVNGLLYWYGGTQLIATGEYTVQQFFVCYIAVVFSAQATGSLFSYAPEIAGAQEAAANLHYLMQSVPSIDAEHGDEEKIDALVGDIEFRDVDFTYSSRPDEKVLNSVNILANHGQFVALVGASGSGKTTALNLVERFYDPSSGEVIADGMDIRSLSLKRFRKSVALVEQDSALIGGTIRECLLSDDESVDDAAIEGACDAANIYEFVVSVLLSIFEADFS
jgi:ATP-binding cassette subfamily B (MDR/TAP) protein 1